MNRNQIIEAYQIPTLLQGEDFRKAYAKLRALVDNKDRAYGRLIRGEVDRRTTKKSARSSTESAEASAQEA